MTVEGESSDSPTLIRSPRMPHKTPGSGAEPQGLVIGQTSGGPESKLSVTALSNSR